MVEIRVSNKILMIGVYSEYNTMKGQNNSNSRNWNFWLSGDSYEFQTAWSIATDIHMWKTVYGS